MDSLRQWQQDALNIYRSKGEPEDFLVTATPGAGKTTFALTFALMLKNRRLVNRIIVVVPTDHLRKQWAEAANRIGLFLDPSLSNEVGPVSSDFDGYVSTYAQVAYKPALHRNRTERQTTLVIFDEIHHAGDGLTWGDGVSYAFSSATKRLCLTGTPFRTSVSERIPFVSYEYESDGSQKSVADYTYGYSEALNDNVVRPVVFAAYSGVSRWKNSAGEILSASLGELSTKEVEMAAWRTALNPVGQWIPHVVRAADERLSQIRSAGMPDAGAMLLASDQEHAHAYAEIVHQVTGEKPVVVLSEDPRASLKIDEFRDSNSKWIIAVRLVSEGVDIPRLACGVWATSYRTPLFFAQAVGRFVRSRRKGETATIFLPAVRPLLALAASMEEARDHVLSAPKNKDETDLLDKMPRERENSQIPVFEAMEAQAEFAHVLYGGQAILGEDNPVISLEDEDYLGLPGLLNPSQMATLLKKRELELKKQSMDEPTPNNSSNSTVMRHHQIVAVKKEINSLVSRKAAKTGMTHAKIHALLRRKVPGPASSSASLELLEQRRDFILSNDL